MRKIIEKRINPIYSENDRIDPSQVPIITGKEYRDRMKRLYGLNESIRPAEGSYSHIIVYADREHFSNMEYLTGFDPRFEEALLIISKNAVPTLIVGLECFVYCEKINFPIKAELYPTFGLMGQSRAGKKLIDILREAGIDKNSKVGLAGWKHFTEQEFTDCRHTFEVPHYIVASILELTDSLKNAGDLFTDNKYGLRHKLDAKEIILAEIAGTKASRSVYEVIKNLKEGMNEVEASAMFLTDGEPYSAHPNLSFGMPNVGYGLSSPSYHNTLKLGDCISVGTMPRLANCHRSCIYAENESQLPKGSLEGFFKPYFLSLVQWYEAIGIGARGGDVYYAAREPLGGSFHDFGIGLNPGHLIHTDEWSNTPFNAYNGSTLHSGMLIQCDYTASRPKELLSVHVEDGIALANKALRDEIERLAPDSMKRIKARQNFMRDTLGIQIKDEVLPMSDIQGMLFIYAKDPAVVLAVDN